ncbi:YbaB/EbfC family nucleoid-associated protein [Saccharopolyspora hordei]|uniref:DNA-binding protein YbaB n=1 Tax=Saccharopolyspora hordei TaxID=1838 RepID=A0A853AUB3_9PSEU|nr:YbaB/EbfC family nucleoid-associated protein [Saccharopolyspora hordei]NYI86263.1 DNA-binding protein YbaB [Saccharopolyspora hordei]
MFSSMHNDMTEALQELRAKQDQLATAFRELDEVTASATSADRTVKATVDGRGRLTDLAFQGRRWRDMAPKELGAKIVEVVADAQRQAAAAVDEVMGGLTPAGVDLQELRENGPDVAAVIDSAIGEVGRWSR